MSLLRKFRRKDNTHLFFTDLLINGHKQGFNIEGNIETIVTRPQTSLGRLIYPQLIGVGFADTRISEAFLSVQYGDFLTYFSKDTSSNLIVLGKNTIFQGVWKLLENAITDALIISKFTNVIKDIIDSNPSNPISYTRAVEIIKELVLSYYYTYYLDNIYVSGSTHDYTHKIYNMIINGINSENFESRGQVSSTHAFFSSFDFVFDLKHAFNDKQMIDVSASLMFYYFNTYSPAATNFNPAWSLRLNSIKSEIREATIKTFTFLQDIFTNYDPNVKHFSIFFHKQGVSGLTRQTTLHNKIRSKYMSDEIEGTYIDVDRSNPQSVSDAIASIVYYMQKYNAFVMVKEGLHNQRSDSLVMCFDQRKIYRPDILQPISATVRISNKFLSSYSEVHYNDWINQYNGIFNAANTYPLYLFHDVDGLPQLIVDSLRIYLNINSRIIKLQE